MYIHYIAILIKLLWLAQEIHEGVVVAIFFSRGPVRTSWTSKKYFGVQGPFPLWTPRPPKAIFRGPGIHTRRGSQTPILLLGSSEIQIGPQEKLGVYCNSMDFFCPSDLTKTAI